MKKETKELLHAIWMLTNAAQNLTSAIETIEHGNEKIAEEWITSAIDSMRQAKKAIEKTY